MANDTNPPGKRILHLGIGAFHRAHMAWYLNRLIESEDGNKDGGADGWYLASGNIRPDMPELLADLRGQDGAYTLETVTPAGVFSYQRIHSIASVLPWSQDLREIVDFGRAPETRIISFTVTEAGYFLDAERALDLSYSDLRSDLDSDSRLTIYGAIAAILRARREDGAGPVTLLCCDNIRGNGDHFKAGLQAFLERRGEHALLDWAAHNTSYPNGMVDRITPRPPAELKARVLAATGVQDACPVMAEEFCQWVVEDHFSGGRPAWEKVGVEMVETVVPYEEAKIRILNASHSCIAWAGALRGYTYIHEATLDPAIAALAHAYVTQDVIPCLTPSPVDLAQYRDTVLERFSNPYVKDTIERVAADGFAKIPGFIAPTIAERLAAGQSPSATAVLPALFLAFLQARAAGHIAFTYRDQAMDEAAAQAILAAQDPVSALCANTVLWGALAGTPALEAAVREADAAVRAWLANAA
jgi:D-arabinitol 4-dehydrogenase